MTAEPMKLGGSVPLSVEGGVPRCPCCGDAMVEASAGVWQCPVGRALLEQQTASMAEAFDRLLKDQT